MYLFFLLFYKFIICLMMIYFLGQQRHVDRKFVVSTLFMAIWNDNFCIPFFFVRSQSQSACSYKKKNIFFSIRSRFNQTKVLRIVWSNFVTRVTSVYPLEGKYRISWISRYNWGFERPKEFNRIVRFNHSQNIKVHRQCWIFCPIVLWTLTIISQK